jgi:hypothetical protein
MKKIFLSVISGLILSLSCNASSNLHFNPKSTETNSKKIALKGTSACLIKITNDSEHNILVSGRFDDGNYLTPFVIYAYEDPQYISLFYYSICHGVMDVRIETSSGLKLYDQETYVNSKIRIKSGWFNPYIVLEKA